MGKKPIADPDAPAANRQPRRHLTVADHIAQHDERIVRLREALSLALDARGAYIATVKARSEALTAELPKE